MIIPELMANLVSTFGNHNYGYYNGQGYQVGFEPNSLGNALYYNAGSIAQDVRNDSQALWDREDSAYQRMVEDMKKAGLNPWTGISSGGLSTGSNNPSMDSLTSLLGILGGLLDSEKTYTQSSKRLYDSLINSLTIGLGFARG